jgi:hypothetical protein
LLHVGAESTATDTADLESIFHWAEHVATGIRNMGWR